MERISVSDSKDQRNSIAIFGKSVSEQSERDFLKGQSVKTLFSRKNLSYLPNRVFPIYGVRVMLEEAKRCGCFVRKAEQKNEEKELTLRVYPNFLFAIFFDTWLSFAKSANCGGTESI